ncbi:MAG: hypothetical protein AAF658_09005 [Myxococcota bacterium]
MNTQLNDIMTAAEGRYITKGEQTIIREYVGGLERRLHAADEVQNKERAMSEKATRAVIDAYPEYERDHDQAFEKSVRDMTLMLRYAAMAMVKNDKEWLNDAVLLWFATILRGIGFTRNFVHDTYATLEEAMKSDVSPETFELMQPYVEHIRVTLSENLLDG